MKGEKMISKIIEKGLELFKEHGKDLAKAIGIATVTVTATTISALSQEGLIETTKAIIRK